MRMVYFAYQLVVGSAAISLAVVAAILVPGVGKLLVFLLPLASVFLLRKPWDWASTEDLSIGLIVVLLGIQYWGIVSGADAWEQAAWFRSRPVAVLRSRADILGHTDVSGFQVPSAVLRTKYVGRHVHTERAVRRTDGSAPPKIYHYAVPVTRQEWEPDLPISLWLFCRKVSTPSECFEPFLDGTIHGVANPREAKYAARAMQKALARSGLKNHPKVRLFEASKDANQHRRDRIGAGWTFAQRSFLLWLGACLIWLAAPLFPRSRSKRAENNPEK